MNGIALMAGILTIAFIGMTCIVVDIIQGLRNPEKEFVVRRPQVQKVESSLESIVANEYDYDVEFDEDLSA